jgi:uncharacterized protein (DUF1800 family)
LSLAELLEMFRDREQRIRAYREFQFATFARAVYGKRQLFEVMVEFWGNHFSVNALDGPLTTLKAYEDRDVMRRHALGRFSDMLQADAKSPAMLYYLDNLTNVKDGPNENYARELFELHTLGVDGGYDENDVQEVARIFTGWGLQRRTGAFRFYPFQHDYGAKQVMGVSFPAGRGSIEGERLLDLLYHLSISGAQLPTTPTRIVDALIEHFLRRPMTSGDRATLIAHAAAGRGPDDWLPWNARAAAARGVLGLILVSRYFQLR